MNLLVSGQPLTSVGQGEERVGLMILKDITPGQVQVSSSGSDLVLHDTKSNCTTNIKNWDSSESHRISTLEFDLGLDPIVIRRLNRFSLSNVEEIQTLIDKASENYKNKADGTGTENDFKCLVSVNGFESGNKTYECLGFSSLQDQINFTEKLCSVEQIEEFKNKMQNSDQVLTLLKKLKDDLSLSGYDQNAIGQYNELVVTSEFKPLISKVAQEGEWNKVKAFLDETANRSSVDIENKNKWSESWTLLHYAVYNGNLNLVNGVFDLLLAKVGDINAQDKWYWTPLHYAVYYNEPNMVKFLIDRGANIEARSKESGTPLYLAVKEGKLDVVKSLFGENVDDNPYKMMKLIRSLEKEIISRANTPSNVKEWAASYVSSLRDSIKSVARKELKNDMFDDSYASTTELANKIYNFDKKLFGGIIKEVVNDVYGEIDTEEMLRFIRSYDSTTQKIQGYVAVFDKMKRENNLNNNAVFNLAFYVKEVMKAGDYSSVNSEKRSELEKIKKELPESLRNLVFSSKVCIKNVGYGRYLYSPSDYKDFQFDSDRRRVFTWPSKLGDDQFKWKVELNGDNVYLKNVGYGRYLYSPSDYKDFQFDSDRRRVFTWPSKLGDDQFKWKVELNGDNVYLKNVGYGRYLYSPSDYKDFQFDSDRRRVFTWPSKLGDDQFKWKVENCGSARKRRDMQHHRKSLQEEGRPVYLESREVDPREELKYLVNEAAKNGEWDTVNFFLDKTAERSPDYIAIKDQFSTSWTTLHYAVYNGNLDLVRDIFQFLSNKNTIINAGDGDDRAPLHYAVLYGPSDMVELLMDEGADIWTKDREEKTPLKVAREHNRLEILKYLVEYKDRDGRTQLYFAAEIGDLDKARFLLENGANIEAKNGEYQATALHAAVINNKLNVVQLLLGNGADIEAEDKDGWKPLHCAATFDWAFNIVEVLVEKGANINAKNNEDKTPLEVANEYNQSKMVNFLVNKRDQHGCMLLHYAAREGNLDLIKLLIINGAEIEAENDEGKTPLEVAREYSKLEAAGILSINKDIKEGKLDEVKHFLANSASRSDTDAKDKDKWSKDWSLLHYAVYNGNLNLFKGVFELLLEKSGSINARDQYGWAPLHYAVYYNEPDIVSFLVDKGADINVQAEDYKTPLHVTAQYNSGSEITRLLLDRGANIEATASNNFTVLHDAVYYNKLDMVEFLVQRGANINAKNGRDETPLEVANRLGRTEIANFLRAKQNEKPVQRKRRHHHGDHPRHHSGEQKYLQREERSIGPKGASRNIENINSAIEGNQQAISGASKPSSWTNAFAHIVDAVKGVSQFISSPFKPVIGIEHSQPSKAMTTQGVDANGTLLLLDVFIRKITGQKYISAADQPTISLPEAECHASYIINGFEKVLKETAVKSGISVTNLNFDPIKLQSDIVGQLINGKFSEISKTLYSSAKQACPEFKQTKRFLERMESHIEEFLDKKEFSSIGQNLKLKKQIRKQKLCSSANFITDNPTIASLANVSRSESQLPGKTDDKPRTCLNDPTVDNQLQRSL